MISIRCGSGRVLSLGAEHRHDGDALDLELGLGLEHVAGLGAAGREGRRRERRAARRAPAARHVHEPSGRALVSSISMRRATRATLLERSAPACCRLRGRASLRRMADLPVLLVHGFASSFERNWREPGWVDLLEDEGRQVIGVDLLGHGQAEKPHDPAAYADLEQDVVSALPADGPVDAIGFSLGAQLLLRVAAGDPARFRRLVVGGVGESVFRGGDSEPAARAIETGETRGGRPGRGPGVRPFARAPGNDPAALAACMRRPTTPLDPAELSEHRPSRSWSCSATGISPARPTRCSPPYPTPAW